jgi:hypothetical protein
MGMVVQAGASRLVFRSGPADPSHISPRVAIMFWRSCEPAQNPAFRGESLAILSGGRGGEAKFTPVAYSPGSD